MRNQHITSEQLGRQRKRAFRRGQGDYPELNVTYRLPHRRVAYVMGWLSQRLAVGGSIVGRCSECEKQELRIYWVDISNDGHDILINNYCHACETENVNIADIADLFENVLGINLTSSDSDDTEQDKDSNDE